MTTTSYSVEEMRACRKERERESNLPQCGWLRGGDVLLMAAIYRWLYFDGSEVLLFSHQRARLLLLAGLLCAMTVCSTPPMLSVASASSVRRRTFSPTR